MSLLGLLAIAAACGDDDGGDETPGPTTGETASPTPTGEPSDTGGASVTAAPTASGPAAELFELVGGWVDGVNGKVTYDYMSNFGQHPDGTYTIYHLDGDSRHDWLNNVGDFGVTLITIIRDDISYICPVAEVNATCREAPEQEARDNRAVFLIVEQTMQVVAAGISDATVTELPGEEVAGVQGNCYRLETSGRISEGPPGTEQLDLCFSGEGELLSLLHAVFFEDEALPNGDLSLVATEVDEASPNDFDPPAPLVG